MKIKKIVLENFRAYKTKTVVDLDDLTVFVGKNDIGKSTILEALDIFLNDNSSLTKIDKDDLSKGSDDDEIRIGVVFSDFIDEVDIDGGSTTSLKNECLLDGEGNLSLFKTYVNGKKKSKYIYAFHPTHKLAKDLLTTKQADLKKLINSNGIQCNDFKKNSIMRSAIRDHCGELSLAMSEIESRSEDAKKIFEKLESYFPIFALFQSDRKNQDQDNEVQDPMKIAIKEALSDEALKKDLDAITNKVKEAAKDIADRTLDKLREMNPDIANNLSPRIPEANQLKWEDVFKKIAIEGNDGIPLNKRGSGVRRLVLLNFFRAQAEKTKKTKLHLI